MQLRILELGDEAGEKQKKTLLKHINTVEQSKKDFPPMGAVEGGEDWGEGVGLVESGC